MKLKLLKQAPILIAIGMVAIVCVARILRPGLFEQLEWKTYDWRVRLAMRFPAPVAIADRLNKVLAGIPAVH